VKWILWYLRGTTGISSSVIAYYNSNYAGDMLAVALSTTKARYIVATEAMKEAIWLRGLVNDLELQ
jgi:hypothetical protein